ncbi:MAG: winged helix-turn-helix domain-containing protein [Chloroflexi bacterium]|nr:winged helix-turn-helix domain-containing protein [Chloroflexota bacterium]
MVDSTVIGEWLQSLGFHHGNPFATNEADRERALLPTFFVDVESYDLIKGEQTAIVFAPRGGGKSSLRIMLASYGAPWSPGASILAVECTDFDLLIEHWHRQRPLTISQYMHWLLPMGMKALFDTIFIEDSLQSSQTISASDLAYRFSRTKELTPPIRIHFARLLHTYCPVVLSAEKIGQLFSLYGVDPDSFDWKQFDTAVLQNQLRQFVTDCQLPANELLLLLADLNDFRSISASESTASSPKSLLADFTDLVRKAGFTSVHFLLDRLDETVELADNPEAQADILEPLLAHLPVMEMPGTAFKFFLSEETRNVLWKRPTVRQEDRLAEYAVTLKWDGDRLKRLLDERLSSYSAHPITGTPEVPDLAAICVENGRTSESVGEKIEKAMLSKAQNSPRRLIMAGRLLFEAHFQRHGGKGRLDLGDWAEAERALQIKFPLVLQLNLAEKLLRLGPKVIPLTPTEYKIVEALVRGEGKCTRDELATAVWGSDDPATEGAMDAAVIRLRKKIGDDTANPIYLRTIRGQGFQLLNHEVVEN